MLKTSLYQRYKAIYLPISCDNDTLWKSGKFVSVNIPVFLTCEIVLFYVCKLLCDSDVLFIIVRNMSAYKPPWPRLYNIDSVSVVSS